MPLTVVSLLSGVEIVDFSYIREKCKVTVGNLRVQIDKLNNAGYISVEKCFKGKMPHTLCSLTSQGKKAFDDYTDTLKPILTYKNYKRGGRN